MRHMSAKIGHDLDPHAIHGGFVDPLIGRLPERPFDHISWHPLEDLPIEQKPLNLYLMKRMLLDVTRVMAVSVLTLVGVGANAQIVDGSFEAGADAGTWTEASVNYGTPLCDAGCGTCGGPCVPRTGTWYAWFGGSGLATEVASVSQDVMIPNGTTGAIQMWVKMPAMGDGTDDNFLRLTVDGNEMDRLTPADSTAYAEYAIWNVPVDAYTDGMMHTVMLEAEENGTAVFNVLVDDVTLLVDGAEVVGLFENEELTGVSIYPNPANEVINFSFSGVTGSALVNITDLSGKLVITNRLNEVSSRIFSLNTSDFQNGAYLITVTQGDKQFTERVMIAH